MADAEPSDRKKQVDARRARLAAMNVRTEERPASVRVNPASDVIRKHISHPSGMKFPESGSVEWPNDQFTKRRIIEGAVTLEGGQQKAAAKPSPPPKA